MQYNDEKCENCESLGIFNKETVLKISQCFSNYLEGIFSDLSKAIMKRLQEQEQKIVKNQKLLHNLSETLLQRSHLSETSLGERERQNSEIQTNRKRISSFKQAKDLITVQKISQTLMKMQANLLYLQGSVKRLQVNPEAIDQIQQGISSQKNFKYPETNQNDLTSKISSLSNKIFRLGKYGQNQQIENGDCFILRKCQLLKSKSLQSISGDKYYPVSCPKRYQNGANSGKNWSESQIIKATQRHKQQHTSKNTPAFKGNKMPLINKLNNFLHQLLPLCQDQADADVIKFHLKKTYRKIDSIIHHHKQPVSSNVLIEQIHQQNIPRKFFATEYFSEKSFSKQSLAQWQQSLQNSKSGQCSIVGNFPTTSETNMTSIKENFTSYKSKCMKQADNSSVQSYGIAKNNITETIRSVQKPKYFQRTSNEHKINMLKKKLKSQTVKF